MHLPSWLPKVYRRTAKAGEPWSFGNWGKGFIDPISNQTHVWSVGGKAADSSRGFMGSPHHVEMAATLHGVPQDRVEAASDPNYDTYRERFYHSPITIAPNGQYCSSNAFNGGYEPDGEEGRFENEYTPLRYISDTGAWEEDNNGAAGYGHAPNMASWHEADFTPGNWRLPNEPEGHCPYCHQWATENPCEHCHNDISITPVQRNYPLDYEQYPIPLKQGLASWHEVKLAANGVFYHTAPSRYRQQIEEQGLLPTNETPHSPWADARDSWKQQLEQPPGVYLHDDPRNATGYAYNLQAQNKDEPYPGDERDFNEDDWDWSGQPDYDKDPEGNENFEPRYDPKPAYDIWKVDARGLPMHIDPESALLHGFLTPEEAQQQINEEKRKYQEPERIEGHRWYTPNSITPDRIQLHDSIYPENMTENNSSDIIDNQKQVPDAWTQVPLNEWNEKARQRYLGEPVE